MTELRDGITSLHGIHGKLLSDSPVRPEPESLSEPVSEPNIGPVSEPGSEPIPVSEPTSYEVIVPVSWSHQFQLILCLRLFVLQ